MTSNDQKPIEISVRLINKYVITVKYIELSQRLHKTWLNTGEKSLYTDGI